MLTLISPVAPGLRSRVAALLLGAALAGSAYAQPAAVLDKGNFIIYQNDKPMGAETFVYALTHDSLTVQSRGYLVIPSDRGEVRYEKGVDMILDRYDYGLRSYQSNYEYGGHKIVRGISVSDTALTLFRELDERGEGNGITRPPGRFYVIDARVFTLMDLICRSLRDKQFVTRPITLLILADPDTVVAATATDDGPETMRWGAKAVVARKLVIEHAGLKFHTWVSPQGQMLRLTEPESGLRVEREAPAVKPRAKTPPPTPKPGG
jgi:hypothetical protein